MHISWASLASFCHLGFISDPLIVSKFHNETHDPKGQENKMYTIEKDREPILKISKPNFVCLLTNERYKTYQMGFSCDRLGHAPGVGLGGTVGVGGRKNFLLKFNQNWCVCVLLT